MENRSVTGNTEQSQEKNSIIREQTSIRVNKETVNIIYQRQKYDKESTTSQKKKKQSVLICLYINAVKLNANISDYFEISLGIKQGEPLSPFLFILFINGSMHIYLEVTRIRLYAWSEYNPTMYYFTFLCWWYDYIFKRTTWTSATFK